MSTSFVHGVLSGKQVSSWEPLVGGEWNHIGLRFEAAEAVLSLILNGTIVATAENVQTYQVLCATTVTNVILSAVIII